MYRIRMIVSSLKLVHEGFSMINQQWEEERGEGMKYGWPSVPTSLLWQLSSKPGYYTQTSQNGTVDGQFPSGVRHADYELLAIRSSCLQIIEK